MSKRSLYIIAIIFLTIVIGVGAAFFVLWGKISNPDSGTVASSETTTEHSMQLADQPVAKKIIYPLKTFVVNLADPGGKRYLRVDMVLELSESRVAGKIKENLPQVRDKILMILPSKTFNDVRNLGGKTALKNEIMDELNSFLQNGGITNLYFQEFVVQ